MEKRFEVLAVKQKDILLYVNNLSSKLLAEFKKSSDNFLYYEENSKQDKSTRLSVDKSNMIYINEWVNYKVEPLSKGTHFNKEDFINKGTYGNENFGTLIFKNCMGFSFFKDLTLSISSKKIDEAIFEKMLNIINNYILNLSFDFNKTTFSSITRDDKKRTDIEYHIFILIMNWLDSKQRNSNLFTLFNVIKSNPHRDDYNRYYHENINEISYIDEDVMVDIFSNLDELIEVQGVDNNLTNKLCKNDSKYVPNKILQTEMKNTFDTNENRFIKYFLKYIIGIISSFSYRFIDNKEKMINYSIIEKSLLYKKELQLLINTTFLRNVGDLSYLPSSSTVLQRKEGYRQLYNYYLKIKSMPHINDINDDLADIIENKNLDLLYEYYCFFMIAEIICGFYETSINNLSFSVNQDEFSKSLSKKTNRNYFNFEYISADLPKVKLFYNKYYTRPYSYSKPYDPDISLEVYNEYDNLEKIIIFDAKFKIRSSSQYNEDSEIQFNSDDITKMHAYKDAINKVCGSFVLYPGDVLDIYSDPVFGKLNKYNGVGAFPLNPGKDNDLLELKKALLHMFTI